MKKLLVVSFAAAALASGSALAADLPAAAPVYKAAPMPAAAPSWTGFYLGAGWGYGVWDADTTAVNAVTGVPLATKINNAGKGWMARLAVGYDYQFNSNIVVGVFADYDPASIKGTMSTGAANLFFSPVVGTAKEKSEWSVGARAGWLLTPSILSYFDGGYTQARFGAINLSDTFLGFDGTIAAHTYHGWFLGSGFVTPLPFLQIPGLFWDTEYRFASYSSATTPIIAPGGGIAAIGGVPTAETIRPAVQTLTTTIVYKFNFTGH
jgi:outer membrane immunogenic protein